MPPKKGQAKKKRVPHANETPLKDKQPGHGAVERAKNQMWSSSSSSSSVQTTSLTGSAVQQAPSAVARPKYKATSTIIGIGGVGIGRGGGGIKKKKAASSAAGATMKNTTTSTVGSQRTAVGRSNPDADFFGGPPLWSTI